MAATSRRLTVGFGYSFVKPSLDGFVMVKLAEPPCNPMGLYMSKLMLTLATAAGLMFSADKAAAAPTLVIDAGILIGANNVLVDNQYYDVSFVDGTCNSLFGGCNTNSNFMFTTSAAALLAATALRDTVFLDVPAGNFDSSLNLTRGCGGTGICGIFVPYGRTGPILVQTGEFANAPSNALDTIRSSNINRVASTSNDDTRVYALFTTAASPPPAIPEPASWAMLIAGFGLTGAMARRRRLRAA